MQHEKADIVGRHPGLFQHRFNGFCNCLNGPFENISAVHLQEVFPFRHQFRSQWNRRSTSRSIQHSAARSISPQLVADQTLILFTSFQNDCARAVSKERSDALIVRADNSTVDVGTDDEGAASVAGRDELSARNKRVHKSGTGRLNVHCRGIQIQLFLNQTGRGRTRVIGSKRANDDQIDSVGGNASRRDGSFGGLNGQITRRFTHSCESPL